MRRFQIRRASPVLAASPHPPPGRRRRAQLIAGATALHGSLLQCDVPFEPAWSIEVAGGQSRRSRPRTVHCPHARRDPAGATLFGAVRRSDREQQEWDVAVGEQLFDHSGMPGLEDLAPANGDEIHLQRLGGGQDLVGGRPDS